MAPAWNPEEVVPPDLARVLVEELAPALAPVAVEALGEGWDNTAYLVRDAPGERWVFRFPRRAIAVPLLEREVALLPHVAARVPLPVPVPEHLGMPSERYRWPFAGYRCLPGRTACTARLDRDARRATATELAHFLRTLHAFPVEEARRLGAGPDDMRRVDLAYRAEQIRARAGEALEKGLLADFVPFEHVLADAPAGWAPGTETLCHGDLYARHLLVDEAGALAGVIDWGDVHLGDPAVDLALAHVFLPPDVHAGFRAAYGAIDEERWRAARLRALLSSLTILVYGDATGDAALVEEARVALGFLAASE